jgi:hypothetical protein
MPVTWRPEEPDQAHVARVLDRVERIIELMDERREPETKDLIEEVNRELRLSMSARAFARIPYERDTREFVVQALEMASKPEPRADLSDEDLIDLIERLRAATPKTNPAERAHWLECLAACTSYPSVATHYEKSPRAAQIRLIAAREVVREMRAYRPAQTVDDVWDLARGWARHQADSHPSLLHACGLDLLRAALDRVNVPELLELHRLAVDQRPLRLRTYMQRLGLPVASSAPPSARSRPPEAIAPEAKPEGQRRVRHAKFGEGVVVAESMRGEDVVLEIDFGGERRKLLRSFVTPIAE